MGKRVANEWRAHDLTDGMPRFALEDVFADHVETPWI